MSGRPMTVTQLLPEMRAGGVEQGTLEMARALSEAGHRAIVVSAGGALVEPLEASGAEHVTLAIGRKSPLTLATVPILRRLLLERGVDILHLRSRLPAWIGLLAWRGLPAHRRPRLVTTVHGFYSPGRYSAVMTRGERVICVSKAIASYVRQNYPQVEPQRLRVIPRGIDPARFHPGIRPGPEWLTRWRDEAPPGDGPLLLLPGRLTRLKGHLEFLRLIGRLRAEGVPARGVIAGGADPRRMAYAREIATAAGDTTLSGAVRLLGHRDDLRELMAVSDLVFSLSRQPESFGRTTLEALSLGRPVVGFDHGGVGEMLAALYPEGAVSAGDEDALLVTVRRMLRGASPPPLRHDYLLERMTQNTIELYRELLDGPRAG